MKTDEQIKTETARAQLEAALSKAEAEKLEAETKKREVQAKLELAEADARLSSTKKAQELAAAEKSLADSKTSAAIAEDIGELKSASYSGAVDLKEKSGTVEALLLASSAVREAATRMASSVGPHIGDKGVSVVSWSNGIGVQNLTNYELRRDIAKVALEAVLRKPVPGSSPASPELPPAAGAALPALGTAWLDAASKVLSFFKTDFTIGGVDAKLDESVAIAEAAGQLRSLKSNVQIHVPQLSLPFLSSAAAGMLVADVQSLAQLQRQALDLQETVDASLKAAEAGLPADGTAREEKQRLVRDLKDLEREVKQALSAYAAFESALLADAGATVELAKQLALRDRLRTSGLVLLIKLEQTGGGYLVKKNLLTGLGASAPLYHMGGATLSYCLFDFSSGAVVAAGVIPVHGGYVASRNIRKHLTNGRGAGSGRGRR